MAQRSLERGPVMADVSGLELTAEERELLCHPLLGGVILFRRNYASPEQLRRLTSEIHALRDRALLIAVDHEGGRVQRFCDGYTRLPPMRSLGALWDSDQDAACKAAWATGYVLAAELRVHGVDLSLTPVLDLDYGPSTVIGDRSFHRDPHAVSVLAGALIEGLQRAGMSGVGKHFPGHGFVSADSHVAVPVDNRDYETIAADDMLPYATLGARLGGIMPAHVIFDRVDPRPAGFSPYWLRTVLRRRLRFDGTIFSDDLSMEGASVAGGIVDRAEAARAAGCDMVLVCNAPDSVRCLVDDWATRADAGSARRLTRLVRGEPPRGALERDPAYADAIAAMAVLDRDGFPPTASA